MAKSRLSSGMKSFLKNRYIPLISRFILGIVFIYASLDKIIDPVSFSDNIDNYHVSPVAINNLVALILPWVELIIGLGLITGIFLKGSLIITIGLLIFFTFIISQAYARGISLNCGCFKNALDSSLVDLRQDMLKRIIEDIILLGLGFIVYFREWFTEKK